MAESTKNDKNNMKVKKNKLLFFEKQNTSNTCRLHAINNALGRSALSSKKFIGYCDEFDMQKHCKGSQKFFFIDSNDNIISFILRKFHIQSSYNPPDDPPTFSEDSCDNIMAVIVFNSEHIWCIKKYKTTWYNFDSLMNEPKPIKFRCIFARQELGRIVVWHTTNSISNEEVFKVHSKIPQHINIDSTNQPLKSASKRSSKRNRIDEDIILNESFLNIDRNGSSQSNRFEILSSIEQLCD